MWDDAGAVGLWSGTARFTRDWTPDVRGNDRLLYTRQTAWESSRNIIRSAEAHDQNIDEAKVSFLLQQLGGDGTECPLQVAPIPCHDPCHSLCHWG